MRVLVTGRHGQIARSLSVRPTNGHDMVMTGRSDLDLADPASIERTVRSVRPDIIISAAAYTAVDRAEDDPDAAYAANAIAPGVLASEARRLGSPIIHLSTDYVFDGESERPYREDDQPCPTSVYGRTKLAGEEAVRAVGGHHVILRTAWIYSPFSSNFLKTILRLAETQDEVRVIGDQIGNPTSALDIADALHLLIAASARGEGSSGTFHLAGSGSTSWAGFAAAILAESGAMGGPTAVVKPIASIEWPSRVARPANSMLDSTYFTKIFGYIAPEWQISMARVVRSLLAPDQPKVSPTSCGSVQEER